MSTLPWGSKPPLNLTKTAPSVTSTIPNSTNTVPSVTNTKNAIKTKLKHDGTRLILRPEDINEKAKDTNEFKKHSYTLLHGSEYEDSKSYVFRGPDNKYTREDELYNFVMYYVNEQGLITDYWKTRAESAEKNLLACRKSLEDCQKRNAELETALADCRKRNAELEAALDDCRKRNAELEAALDDCLKDKSTFAEGEQVAPIDDEDVAEEKKSSHLMWWLLGGTVVAGGGYYIYKRQKH